MSRLSRPAWTDLDASELVQQAAHLDDASPLEGGQLALDHQLVRRLVLARPTRIQRPVMSYTIGRKSSCPAAQTHHQICHWCGSSFGASATSGPSTWR